MRIYDTMRNQILELEPREPGKVSIYACGPTVYDVPHLGHARTALTYDTLKRYLEWDGYDVVLVSNITDIDDKIIERSKKEKESVHSITNKFFKIYNDDMEMLNVMKPDYQPKATEFVEKMISAVWNFYLVFPVL